MQRVNYLIQKEFRQILREKAFIVIIFGMPFIQLVIFGFAVNTDIKNIAIAFLDQDHSAISRQITEAFVQNESFTEYGSLSSRKEALASIEQGRIQIAIIIPPHFARDLKNGSQPDIQVLTDGVDGNTAGLILTYVNQISRSLQKKIIAGSPLPSGVHLTKIITSMWYNAELESKNNIVPGVIGVLLTMITSFLTGMSIVREKEIGTLEQLMVTPIKKHELIIGKVIPFAVVGFLLLNVGILAAGIIFGLWMKGSLLSLYFVSLLFMLSTLGLGIFSSTLARTQQQAMFITWFFTIFALLLSGFFIPIENMPRLIQVITYLNPLRYFMIVIREIYLKGTPLLYLWKQALFMLIFGIIVIFSASVHFRKRVG